MDHRPPRRPWHACTALDDFAIVTYAVDPARLRTVLPAGFDPDLIDVGGRERGFVSAVPFRDRDFCFRGMSLITLSCGQVNYRAYVRRGGERGVWFFGTSLDSWLVAVPRRLWSMPWHRDRIELRATWTASACERWSLAVAGAWGRARSTLRGTRRRVELGWLGDLARSVLLDPTTGWYRRRDGALGRYSVWHRPLEPFEAEVESAHFSVFEDLGLVHPADEPISALVQQTVDFDVHTPPRRGRDAPEA